MTFYMKTYDKINFEEVNKGNLHTHTTRTDGEFSVDEIAQLYKRAGYKFLAITDHRIYFDKPESAEGMILLSGCEYNCYLDQDERIHFHLLTLKDSREDDLDRIQHDDNQYKSLFFRKLSEVQGLIDTLRYRGNLVVIAHPDNPFIPREMLFELKDYQGIEVFNTKADQDATELMEELFEQRFDLLFTAADDAHRLEAADGRSLFYKGFIVVEDGVRTAEDVIKTVERRRFYASQGPLIKMVEIEGDLLTVKHHSVKKVEIKMYGQQYLETVVLSGESGYTSKLLNTSTEGVILKLEDQFGKKAWFAYSC